MLISLHRTHSLFQDVKCIFFLFVDDNTCIELCYLDPQKVFEFAHVYSLKMMVVLFKSLNIILITVYNDYVVRIDNEINTLPHRAVLVENKMTSFTPNHSKLLNDGAKMTRGDCFKPYKAQYNLYTRP